MEGQSGLAELSANIMGVRFSEVYTGFHCIPSKELINSNANCLEIASLLDVRMDPLIDDY